MEIDKHPDWNLEIETRPAGKAEREDRTRPAGRKPETALEPGGAEALIRSVEKMRAGSGTRAALFRRICRLIPSRISNKTIIRVMDFLRRAQRGRKLPARNRKANTEAFRNHREAIRGAGGFIENQSRYGDMRYGKSTVRYSGCEIIAVYNAMYDLTGRHEPLPGLISAFEKDGMILSGLFGTAPGALRDFLKKRSFSVRTTTVETEFNRLGRESDGLILTMYNDGNDLRQEVHTVYISKTEEGLIAHNVYGDGRTAGPCSNVTELIGSIHKGRAKGIFLLGIRMPA